ncbi:MAG: hypothetical protein ACI92I_000493, partial [Acidimicrobiales bacterium]
VKLLKMKRMAPWMIFLLLMVGGIYGSSILAQKSNASRPGEAVSVMKVEHIEEGERFEGYNSNPPTSGPHAGPAPWGMNYTEHPDENLVHNLEHGGIWISHKNLTETDVATLESIARGYKTTVVVSPREQNDANIAVASWGRLLKLDILNEAAIKEFIQLNTNKSPEPMAR